MLFRSVYRQYQTGTGPYNRADPLSTSDSHPYTFAAANPMKHTDPMGLRIAIEPFFTRYVRCALRRGFQQFTIAWTELQASDKLFHLRRLTPHISLPESVNTRIKAPRRYYERGKQSFSWPPNCDSSAKYVFVETPKQYSWERTPPTECQIVMKALVHELIETHANCNLGLPPSDQLHPNRENTAHAFASNFDNDAESLCKECCD